MNPFLLPFEPFYRRQMAKRRSQMLLRRELETVPCPILSVGNLSTGGTGKTPAVQWAARFLGEKGWNVGVASRGYGGELSEKGALVSDGTTTFLNAQQAGDEPILHARNLPGVVVAIARDRHLAVELCAQNGANLVILDDGFQFWSLPRAFELVLLDARRPFGNHHLLPAGRLREEPAALSRADAILLTRVDRPTLEELKKTYAEVRKWTNAPIFESWHTPRDLRDEKNGALLPLSTLKNANVRAFAGLENNGQFYHMLAQLGARFVYRLERERGDHHVWKKGDFGWQSAPTLGAAVGEFNRLPTVTTEKDAVKTEGAWFDGPLWSLRIELRVRADELALQTLILSKLG